MEELWRRIVFSIMISNTDDHLRNHGFLYSIGQGWILSPAYDLNPNITRDSFATQCQQVKENSFEFYHAKVQRRVVPSVRGRKREIFLGSRTAAYPI